MCEHGALRRELVTHEPSGGNTGPLCNAFQQIAKVEAQSKHGTYTHSGWYQMVQDHQVLLHAIYPKKSRFHNLHTTETEFAGHPRYYVTYRAAYLLDLHHSRHHFCPIILLSPCSEPQLLILLFLPTQIDSFWHLRQTQTTAGAA
jgi:hypothetical protein